MVARIEITSIGWAVDLREGRVSRLVDLILLPIIEGSEWKLFWRLERAVASHEDLGCSCDDNELRVLEDYLQTWARGMETYSRSKEHPWYFHIWQRAAVRKLTSLADRVSARRRRFIT